MPYKQLIDISPYAGSEHSLSVGSSGMSSETTDASNLMALESLIRKDSSVIMRTRVRYTRIVRELHRLNTVVTKSEEECLVLQRYKHLERRISRQLAYLEAKLSRDIQRRNRRLSELSAELDT